MPIVKSLVQLQPLGCFYANSQSLCGVLGRDWCAPRPAAEPAPAVAGRTRHGIFGEADRGLTYRDMQFHRRPGPALGLHSHDDKIFNAVISLNVASNKKRANSGLGWLPVVGTTV